MEDYKAQYYNEALMHYGVKGMKWGVRRKRIAAAVKKSAKTYGNFQKERLKAFGNAYTHPIMTGRAMRKNMKNDKLRTKVAKINAHAGRDTSLSTKEMNAINEAVKARGIKMKALKAKKRRKKKQEKKNRRRKR